MITSKSYLLFKSMLPLVLCVCFAGFFSCKKYPAKCDNCQKTGATPEAVQDRLKKAGKVFEFDCKGGAIVPGQLVIWFDSTATATDRANIRGLRKSHRVNTCPCDTNMILVELNNLAAESIIEILENTGGSADGGGVSGQDLNHYAVSPGDENSNQTLPSIDGVLNIAQTPKDGDVIAAILDTGIDWSHADCYSLNKMIWRNPGDGDLNNADDDKNGLTNDVIGWDFVNKDNNPFDDNSHGTHVAGIVLNTLQKKDFKGSAKFMFYKVLNERGIGTIFDVACASLCAAQKGAQVINMSLGWYGDENDLFALVAQRIRDQYGTIIAAAAGNDGRDMNYSKNRMYPACYAHKNIFSVAAIEDPAKSGQWQIWKFSNQSPIYVDMSAPGVGIESCIPGGGKGLKSGTSMATPVVTANLVFNLSNGTDAYLWMMNLPRFPSLEDKVTEGKMIQ
jgi:subtilisin family serine protease